MKSPRATMWLSLVTALMVIGLALFLAAGTINYWQAWTYLGVVAVSSVPLTLAVTRNSVLLEHRTEYGPMAEKRTVQQIIVWCLGISSLATVIVPALDRRFGWSNMPLWLSLVGDLLLVLAMRMVVAVFKENAFGSATVAVTNDQRVISTGPYAIVRNPMYASAAVFFVGTPLALGSYWGLIASLVTMLCFVWRLLDEEEFLAQNLPGYKEYCAKVHWHLIPGIF